MKLTVEHLREVLHYDQDTGIWTRKINRGRNNRYKAGEIVGHLNAADGYITIRLDNILYLAHRLAWFYMTGQWPKHQVDHKNLNRSDNKWLNLREATHGQNVQNSSLRKNNISGFKGAHKMTRKYKLRRPFRARITVDRKEIYIGSFRSAKEAHKAYLEAATFHFGEYARAK